MMNSDSIVEPLDFRRRTLRVANFLHFDNDVFKSPPPSIRAVRVVNYIGDIWPPDASSVWKKMVIWLSRILCAIPGSVLGLVHSQRHHQASLCWQRGFTYSTHFFPYRLCAALFVACVNFINGLGVLFPPMSNLCMMYIFFAVIKSSFRWVILLMSSIVSLVAFFNYYIPIRFPAINI